MLRHDLESADIPYEDDMGRVFDFHALRHQFISNLAAAGVHPKIAQTLARHSTITLTMDRYTHMAVSDVAGALEHLPKLGYEAEAAQSTGTDNRNMKPTDFSVGFSCTNSASSEVTTGHQGSSAVPEPSSGAVDKKQAKPLKNKGFGTSCPPLSGDAPSAPCRNRTYNLLIKSQLLCQLS